MLISVIIPVFNTEKYISACIQSVLNQTMQDFEIIIVDDKTPDRAMEVVKYYTNIDNRIKILYHEYNRGPMVARRTGYEAASGDYLMFLDSDDTLTTDALESLSNRILRSDSDFIMAGYNKMDGNGLIIAKSLPCVDGIFDSKVILHKLMKKELTHNLAFCLFRKKIFNDNFETYENQTNGEDLVLFYQLVERAKKIDVYPYAVYNYRLNLGSSSKSPITARKIQQLVNVQNFKFNFLTRQGIPEKDIIRNINPTLLKWICYDFGRQAITQLPIPVQNSLKINHVYRYLPFMQATYVSIIRFFPCLSPLFRHIFL